MLAVADLAIGVIAVCSSSVTASSLTATHIGVLGNDGLMGLAPLVPPLEEVAGGGRAGMVAGNRAAPKWGHLRRHVRQIRTHSAWLRPRRPIHFSCRLSRVDLTYRHRQKTLHDKSFYVNLYKINFYKNRSFL